MYLNPYRILNLLIVTRKIICETVSTNVYRSMCMIIPPRSSDKIHKLLTLSSSANTGSESESFEENQKDITRTSFSLYDCTSGLFFK